MKQFAENIVAIYGKRGEQWLKDLPAIVKQLEGVWDLSDLKAYEDLSHNYVMHGYQGAEPVVLKLGLDLENEATALRAFGGSGMVALLDHEENALLLQRAEPGSSLKGDCAAIEIACKLMERLHQAPLPEEGVFPLITHWFELLEYVWPIPREFLQMARRFRNELLPKIDRVVLLHGDLHQGNILANGGEWLAIDPKGVIGAPINEVWAFIEDLECDLMYVSVHFNFELGDVMEWYFVHLVLAACWRMENGLSPNYFLSKVEQLQKNPGWIDA
jgi:streptomycin 6-kinase